MVKFKNKKTKDIVEENLIFYIDKLRKNPDFEEIKKEEKPKENKGKSEKIKEEENIIPQN